MVVGVPRVGGGGGKHVAVGAEGHIVNAAAGINIERLAKRTAVSCVPEPYGPVVACGGERPSVRAE
jgi:hypothetical protein